MADIAVVAQDPGFGGGSLALADAFVDAVRANGREPELVYLPHPHFRPSRRASLERIEAVRILRGSRLLAARLREARQVWVVAGHATHGLAAAISGRPYACWVATSLHAENTGRAPGLPVSRRLALYLNEPVLTRVERAVLRDAVRVYVTSPASRTDIARAGRLDEGAVRILTPPVDASTFFPEPDESWLARLEAPVIAFVGRSADPRKNVALARAALAVVRRRIPHAELRVIGDGIASVAEPLREASLLLSPSRQEGFGIVVAEALASGVPVVATPSGGPEELLRASGAGRILGGFDAEDMGNVAAELLSDPDLLLRMRHAGRQHVVR
ncbi:MAG TPA: glycosyltransferase family 4 protein, partial [Gaiellaceae bacterium]|nr:glycosyltransferase family 4 protein [Gaiellaceae bacterium]